MIYLVALSIGMNMGHPGGPMYGMTNNNNQRRPAPYPNPMYMQSKRLQQPSAFPPSGMVGVNKRSVRHVIQWDTNMIQFINLVTNISNYFTMNNIPTFSTYFTFLPFNTAGYEHDRDKWM